MSQKRFVFIIGLMMALFIPVSSWADDGTYIALNYHDIKDQVDVRHDDATTISTDAFVLQLNWLQKHGYTSIGMDDVLAARNGTHPLPPKSVLLTFDDGYESFYTRVYPLLKSFKFKAVQAVVGHWLDAAEECKEQTLDKRHAGCGPVGTSLLTWDQIKEMQASGLVEIASHTFSLHHGITANPQEDKLPAATSLEFNPDTKTYETLDHYRERLRQDLAKNSAEVDQHIGIKPRIVVWPYGSHHTESVEVAKQEGMPYNMILKDEVNRPTSNMISRYLMLNSTSMEDFAAIMDNRKNHLERVVRAMHVDLDYLYDPNPAQQRKNLDALIERVSRMGANTVFLQAFSDTDGDGAADAVYFPNRYLPVREDLFSDVAWRLRTRLHVKVYAWMPVMAFHMPESYHLPLVEAVSPDKKGVYYRISPFDEHAKEIIKNIYTDLSMHARFDGILFHDDATLNDFEDASAPAKKVYKEWGLKDSIQEIKADAAQRVKWFKLKTDYLNQWTLELAAVVQRFQETGLLTARNIYALPVLQPEAEEWFAQSLESFLKTYNYTAIMAMPYMEGVPLKDHEAWLIRLVNNVAAFPGALGRTVFELQTVDWKTKQHIADEILARQMFILQQNAVLNLAYYPDDFPANRPEVGVLRRYFAWEQ